MQANRQYHEISHFRAPYKDSVYMGYGVYERPMSRELHGQSEYMPLVGVGADAPAASTALAAPLFEVVGNLQFATAAGDAALTTMLSPYQAVANSIAAPGANGDVSIIAWIGPGTPPADMGAGPFTPLGQLLSTLNKGGMVVLGDMQLNQPTAGKRVFILTKNVDTIATQARSGGLFFLSSGADPTLVASAQKRVKQLYAPSMLAGFGPLGMAAAVAGVGAIVLFAFAKKKGHKSKKKS
jgi:hypothetical protein